MIVKLEAGGREIENFLFLVSVTLAPQKSSKLFTAFQHSLFECHRMFDGNNLHDAKNSLKREIAIKFRFHGFMNSFFRRFVVDLGVEGFGEIINIALLARRFTNHELIDESRRDFRIALCPFAAQVFELNIDTID